MSATRLFYARVDKAGVVKFDQPFEWAKHCAGLKEQLVEVTCRKRRTQRSLKQNRAYFGLVVSVIAEHCGYTKDEAHEALAFKFLRMGEPDALLPTRRSTADLTTGEFEVYQAQVKQFAAEELGLYIRGGTVSEIYKYPGYDAPRILSVAKGVKLNKAARRFLVKAVKPRARKRAKA